MPCQERFCSHPVTVVRSNEGAIHVTTRQRSGSRRLDPQYRLPDKSFRSAARSSASKLSADGGQDIVLAEGRAELITGADRHPHFLAAKFREKYAPSLGAMSFEQWRSTFSQPLLIHVERIIACTRTAAGVAYRIVP